MASAFNKRPDPSVLEKVLEEENPSRTFCVERRLSWKAPPQFSGPGEGDVSETTLFPEGESSQADVSKEQERGASSGADTAETHAYGLSPLRLGKGNRSASPVSVRTRVKLWEVKAGKGASSRGALIGTLPEVGAAELTERHEPAPEQSERNEAVTEVSGAYGKTGKRDQREPMSDLEKDSDGYETKQMMEERGLVASMAAGSQADVSKEGDDVSKRATPQNMGLEPAWAHQGGAEKQAAPESRLRDGDGTAEDWTTNGTAALWLGEEEKDRTMEPSLRGRERNDSAERSGIVKAARNVAAHLVVVVEPERDGGERSAEPKERNEAEQSATVEPERNGAKCSGGTEPERTAAERSTELESGRNEAELSVVTERERNAADDLAVPVEPGRHGAEPSARPELERKATEPSAVTELERDAAEHSAVVEPGRNGAEQSKATEPKHNGAEQLGPRGFPVRGWWGQWAVYLANRKAQAAVLALSLAANAGLFAYVYVLSLDKAEYQIVGFWFCIARGAGKALKLNLALILLPVSRLTNTALWNRARGRAAALPVQSAVTFHEIIGFALLFWTLLHALVHLAATYPRLAAANATRFEGLVGNVYGDAQPNYWALLKTQTAVTGFMIIAIMLIAYPLAAPWVRRCRVKNVVLRHITGFEAFWYSHVLLLLCFPLAILHGSRRPLGGYPTTSTWIWLAAPLLFYAFDRGLRAARIWRNRNRAVCLQADTLPGDVLGLTLARPPGFAHRPGQYVFINCPRVSAFQWHPFSLTSAPSDALLRVHIRTSVGDWTSALGQKFHQAVTGSTSPPESTDLETGKLPRVILGTEKPPRVLPFALPRLLLDGPYAAPSQDFARFKVIILIGAGIGVTPFASVVRECLRHLSPKDEESTSASESPAELPSPSALGSGDPIATGHLAARGAPSRKPQNLARVQKVYLHWVAKNRAALTWFERHFDDVSREQMAGNRVEMTSYLTRESGVNAAAAATATAFQRADRSPVDVALGGLSDTATKIVTKLGRPDWDLLFLSARQRHPNTNIGVFYCGPRSLNPTLSRLCCKHTVGSTHFEFFKENY